MPQGYSLSCRGLTCPYKLVVLFFAPQPPFLVPCPVQKPLHRRSPPPFALRKGVPRSFASGCPVGKPTGQAAPRYRLELRWGGGGGCGRSLYELRLADDFRFKPLVCRFSAQAVKPPCKPSLISAETGGCSAASYAVHNLNWSTARGTGPENGRC